LFTGAVPIDPLPAAVRGWSSQPGAGSDTLIPWRAAIGWVHSTKAPHRTHRVARHPWATIVEPARAQSVRPTHRATGAHSRTAHPHAASHSTLSHARLSHPALPESTLSAAHRAHPAGRETTTLGHPLANANALGVAEYTHRRGAGDGVITDDDAPQRAQRVAFGTVSRYLLFRGWASAWPQRVESSAQSAAQALVALQQRPLDGIELRELSRAEIQFASHVDERRYRVATNASRALSHPSLCVHRDGHRHRQGEDGGAGAVVQHCESLHWCFQVSNCVGGTRPPREGDGRRVPTSHLPSAS
jgi:hypothetical protein